MKSFTPDLIVRGQSRDEDVVDEVEVTRERRGDECVAYLASVKKAFLPGVRRIEENYYLHDAKIQGLGMRDGKFVMVLQLATPPYSLLTLAYDLIEEPHINRNAVPDGARFGGTPMWQYNELEHVPGTPPTWKESLLLSNGWEVELHFRDVHVEEVQALIPAPRNGAVSTFTLPQPV